MREAEGGAGEILIVNYGGPGWLVPQTSAHSTRRVAAPLPS